MEKGKGQELRRGWTTGACATAATKAALIALWGGERPATVSIALPRGDVFESRIKGYAAAADGAMAACVEKDAGDDPDVTHGVDVWVKVWPSDGGVQFHAGDGVGTVTKDGLPIAKGEPAINPVPRSMMDQVVAELAVDYDQSPDVNIAVSIPNGDVIAQKTWNPRLGIVGGLSVLGTTGIVRPFSCSAWIASIHRGIDVARAEGVPHVAGCTGATSERVVQGLYDLPESAMLDMGDFAGGLLKYLAKNPVRRITIGGGIGKMTKLAQGARDLHSGRTQVDFENLAQVFDAPAVAEANTTLQAYDILGARLADWVAEHAKRTCQNILGTADITVDVVVIDRAGNILAQA